MLFIFRELRALLIILGELGSKHILLGISGALPKSKNKKNKYQAFHFILFFEMSLASGGPHTCISV